MGIRVIKTAIAVLIAVSIAKGLGLNYALGAGILAILGIDVTLKRSVKSVSNRLLASVTALVLASGLFYLIGFHMWAVAIYIMVAYPILARVKLADGIVTSSVVVFHIVDRHAVSVPIVWNEIVLLLVGLGTASVINFLYMPSADKELKAIRVRVEELFSAIFLHMAEQLRHPDAVWDGRELLAASDAITEGRGLARRSAENKLFQVEDSWLSYFDMRLHHLESIQRMLQLEAQVFQSLPHGEAVAGLFEGLSEDVRSASYTGNVEASLQRLEQEFKRMALPATREEFEVRSALLQLCLELAIYLSMSKKGKKSASPEAVQKR